MYLSQHEEVRESCDTESNGDAKDEETDEISSTTGVLVSEDTDCRNNATATRARDPQSHDTGEKELAEEDKEEEHKVETRVVTECLIGGSEPAKEREGDKEEAIDQAETQHGALILAREKEAESPKDVTDHQKSVEEPKVVEPLHHLLEFHWYVHIDVLVEAWLTWHETRERGPIINPCIIW